MWTSLVLSYGGVWQIHSKNIVTQFLERTAEGGGHKEIITPTSVSIAQLKHERSILGHGHP